MVTTAAAAIHFLRHILSATGGFTMLRKNLLGNQLDDEQEAEGDDDQIVHIAENRDEIRDQVNGAKQYHRRARRASLTYQGIRGSLDAK